MISRRLLRSRSSVGFTLIELMVATVVFGIIMLAWTSLFSFAIKQWLTVTNRFEANANIYGMMDLLGMNVRSALPPYSESGSPTASRTIQFEGRSTQTLTNSVDGELEFHMVAFTDNEGDIFNISTGGSPAASHVYPGSDVLKTYYWLRKESPNDSVVRERRATSKYGDPIPITSPGTQGDFAYSIEALKFEFYNGSAWVTSWDSNSTEALPKLVRVTVSTEVNNKVTTGVFILRPMATGTEISQ